MHELHDHLSLYPMINNARKHFDDFKLPRSVNNIERQEQVTKFVTERAGSNTDNFQQVLWCLTYSVVTNS